MSDIFKDTDLNLASLQTTDNLFIRKINKMHQHNC